MSRPRLSIGAQVSELLPPWVIRKNGAYLGAFGWVGTNRAAAASFNSQHDAANWSRANPIARGAEVVNDPYLPPEPERGPSPQSDFDPMAAAG